MDEDKELAKRIQELMRENATEDPRMGWDAGLDGIVQNEPAKREFIEKLGKLTDNLTQ